MSADIWLAGSVAALLQVTVGEFAAAAYGTQTSPLRATGRWLIDAIPTPLIDVSVALLRRADKPFIAAAMLLLSLSVAALAALAGRAPLVLTLVLLGTIGLAALWRRVELSRVAACGIGLAALGAGVGGVWLSPAVALAITISAFRDATSLGFDRNGIVGALTSIQPRMFVKSMTTLADHRVWQDVYHVPADGLVLYV